MLFRHTPASLADGMGTVSCYPAGVSLQIMRSDPHPRIQVDPFGQLPCEHESIVIHTTNGQGLGDDLLECPRCEYAVSLSDLYAAIKLPPGLLPTS